MKFQTQIPLRKQDNNLIDYNSKLLLVGSCFSDNIGYKLEHFKFQSVSNPFGVLFHPKAIENLIIRAIQHKKYSEKDIFFYNEQWHCFDAHSQLSDTSKEKLLRNLNANLEIANKQIQEASHIIITLGTAWVYNLLETNKIVANCHKVPQKQFNKTILSVEAITKSLQTITKTVQSINNKALIIFTVSPVRHIKDGFLENTQSKSHLITAIHQILNEQVSYFPSYEIMLDELRDYRFYKADMLHPNEIAIEFIWQKFIEVWVSINAKKTMEEVSGIQKGLLHKPFNDSSEAHQEFLRRLEERVKKVKSKYSFIQF